MKINLKKINVSTVTGGKIMESCNNSQESGKTISMTTQFLKCWEKPSKEWNLPKLHLFNVETKLSSLTELIIKKWNIFLTSLTNLYLKLSKLSSEFITSQKPKTHSTWKFNKKLSNPKEKNKSHLNFYPKAEFKKHLKNSKILSLSTLLKKSTSKLTIKKYPL